MLKLDDQTSMIFLNCLLIFNSFKIMAEFTFTGVTQGAYVVQQTHFPAAGITTRINNCICCSFPVS